MLALRELMQEQPCYVTIPVHAKPRYLHTSVNAGIHSVVELPWESFATVDFSMSKILPILAIVANKIVYSIRSQFFICTSRLPCI